MASGPQSLSVKASAITATSCTAYDDAYMASGPQSQVRGLWLNSYNYTAYNYDYMASGPQSPAKKASVSSVTSYTAYDYHLKHLTSHKERLGKSDESTMSVRRC